MYPPPHSHAQKWPVCKKDYFTVTADTRKNRSEIVSWSFFVNSIVFFMESKIFWYGEILANFFQKT
jgi:hypothetical protein